MLVNTTWLLEYLQPPCSEKDLLRALASTGLEIEAYHSLAQELESIAVGFIREKSPLPGSNGMYLCRAEIQSGEMLQVVCASEHPVEVGWGVPIARGGTKLPTGIQIKNERFHGVSSEGMICLDSELGILARGSGLQVFHDESAMGRRLVDLIEIPDSILDLKAPPNRPDLLSLIGIAREVAAILGLSLKLPVTSIKEGDATTAQQVRIEIEDGSLCRRYMCRLIMGVSISKSPAWLSSRIRSAGSNPINNVVDITNFVMREWGQPLHAFDFHTLRGARIITRRMLPTERLELLNGTVISGETQPLVIADAERPIALAGIMGGKETQINDGTQDVLLEAAYFDPIQIKKALAALPVESTDASYRFERGMDPNLTLERALDRAAALIAEVAGGTVAKDPVDVYVNRMEPRQFQLTSRRVSSYLGKLVDESTIQDCLQRLEMKCSTDLLVEVPTWRVDVNDPVALIEDVARLTGYDQIPLASPLGALTAGKRNSLDALRRRVTLFLANTGFLESRNLTLESPELVSQFSPETKDNITLVNSMKEDMSVLRKSLLPGLLETVARNARREAENFRYFELDRTFYLADGEPVETWVVAAVAGGLTRDIDWSSNTKISFFHMKGIAESLLEATGISSITFRPAKRTGFMEGHTAEVLHGDKLLGVVGAIDRALLSSRKIKTSIYGFEFNLQNMLEVASGVQTFKGLPRTPAVVRDIAVVLDSSIMYADLDNRIREVGGGLLEQVQCIDVYEGEPIQDGKRSISFRLRFRDPQRTLSTEEVSETVERIVGALKEEYDAKLRE
jgi:phenylalanyl-tRNA synthetase beta chain